MYIYYKIKNPINNKFYSINSKLGKYILNKYLNIIYGGTQSTIPDKSFKIKNVDNEVPKFPKEEKHTKHKKDRITKSAAQIQKPLKKEISSKDKKSKIPQSESMISKDLITNYIDSINKPNIPKEIIDRGREELSKVLYSKIQYLKDADLFKPLDEWDWKSPNNEISYVDRGFYGLVFKSNHAQTNLAIKVIPISEDKSQGLLDQEKFNREVELQKETSMYNISPKIYDNFIYQYAGDKIIKLGVIIMEYLEGYINDFKYINEKTDHRLKVNIDKILKDNIIRTINILVDICRIDIIDFQTMVDPITFDIKIIDFGQAKKFDPETTDIDEIKKSLASRLGILF